MKAILGIIALFCSICLNAQTRDTVSARTVPTGKFVAKPIQKAERMPSKMEVAVILYGEYTITGYSVLSTKTPSHEELNTLIGTIVKFQETSLTGTGIDPLTFEIYQVEQQRKDDFIFRVFGRGIRAQEPSLPESFKVHKTDNENCYGIAEIGNGEIAIPYKGVLLYLKRN